MRHWSQLGIRNWLVKPGRTAGALAAIALGVGVVIWVTCAYESVRLALMDQVWFWTGRSHLSVESPYGAAGTVSQYLGPRLQKELPNIERITWRLKTPLFVQPLPGPGAATRPQTQPDEQHPTEVDAIGIDPTTEYAFRDYGADRIAGRLLTADDVDAVVVEESLASNLNLKLGDKILLFNRPTADPNSSRSAEFTIVGFVEHRRVAKQQLPIVMAVLDPVQKIAGYDVEPKRVTKIDLMLKDASDIAIAKSEISARRLVVDRLREPVIVTTARSKLQQIRAAEQQTGFVLLLISTVALFTAFFVILSTLSMGMVERVGQLGTLRCLGVTRLQVAGLVLAESVPLGLVGVALGIPVGLGLAQLSVWLVPEYVGHLAINPTGFALALIGGAVTTLLGGFLPMVQAARISPLAASRPQSHPPAHYLNWFAAIVGVGMIAGHTYLIQTSPPNKWFEPLTGALRAVSAVTLLYAGFALITPALVRVVGQGAVLIAASILRVRSRLLSDQVGRATWRSAAICSGLMVGLSLIVSLVVHSQSLASGWDFPKKFCEAYVHIAPPIPRAQAQPGRTVGGVKNSALVNVSTLCTIYGGAALNFPISRFIASDSEDFFAMATLEFISGNQTDAIAKLKRGGYVLVTPEFVRSHKRDLGQKIKVLPAGGRGRAGNFEIAGVVTSPALDIAANYFNMGGMLVSNSAQSVLGTQQDLYKLLNVPDEISMVLLNFDLPGTAIPPEFQAAAPPSLNNSAQMQTMIQSWRASLPERQKEIDEIAAIPTENVSKSPMLGIFRQSLRESIAMGWTKKSPDDRWRAFREEMTMRLIGYRAKVADESHASVRALKMQIDQDLKRATMIFSTIPLVALVVAALGVGNLMMANISNRTRQIAMLRAVGATQWQIVRLIIGEAIVLGTLGSLLGLGLGLHAAHSMNTMTESIWGYRPEWNIPWLLVGTGVAFTMSVCLVAGILPARLAARTNIVKALQAI